MTDRPSNAFLRSLTEASWTRLEPHLAPCAFAVGDMLYRVGERLAYVHFSTGALLSLLSTDTGGQTVETFMAGREGAAGLLEACGSGVSSLDCVTQVDGDCLRAPAGAIRDLVRTDPEFADAAWRLIELQVAESRQSGLCLTFHTVEERLARWLLESIERSRPGDHLPVTQEFLGAMLGVQRTTVNAFAGQLSKSGLIDYTRGRVRVLDADGLEARACECRNAVRATRDRLGLTPMGLA